MQKAYAPLHAAMRRGCTTNAKRIHSVVSLGAASLYTIINIIIFCHVHGKNPTHSLSYSNVAINYYVSLSLGRRAAIDVNYANNLYSHMITIAHNTNSNRKKDNKSKKGKN